MYIQIASLELCSLPRALEMFTGYLKYVHIEAGTIHCYTPSPRWGTGLEGGICNPGSLAGLHIHIRNTSPDRDVMLSGIRVL
jgi:hypothetical protein